MKIATIIGARPQFIKAAAVSREIALHSEVNEIIVHTGQHFDSKMSDIFFQEMGIPKPQYFLDTNSLGHGAMTGRMLEKIEELLIKERPEHVLVYGDTNTTLAGALAAKKLYISLAHVEAGLRSYNMKMPEEINRIVTDRISDILFCPTDAAVQNLVREGFEHFPAKIVKVGDVMLDAARYYSALSPDRSKIVQTLKLRTGDFILCTIHRAENTDDPKRLTSIISALNIISRERAVVLPLHPRTAQRISALNIQMDFDPIEPVGYFDMIELLKGAKVVLTDSGGLQKEAYMFSKPCVTLRDETEWVELVEHGYNMLSGADRERIYASYRTMMKNELHFGMQLYGNGNAAREIVTELINSTVN